MLAFECLRSQLTRTEARLQIDGRAGHVPSEYFKNPLSDLFQYFDTDEDGFIDAQGIYAALKLKGIGITEEQVRLPPRHVVRLQMTDCHPGSQCHSLLCLCGAWCLLARYKAHAVQVETFVKASDKNDDKRIDCSEFEHLVHQMADVDKNIYGLRID